MMKKKTIVITAVIVVTSAIIACFSMVYILSELGKIICQIEAMG